MSEKIEAVAGGQPETAENECTSFDSSTGARQARRAGGAAW